MSVKLTVVDQAGTGKVINELVFEVAENLTARELIRKRVFEEVTMFNLSGAERYNGLVQPADTEVALNNKRAHRRREINWEEQADAAVDAFEQNGFFILVDEVQIKNLDDVIQIREDTRVEFVRLVQLVGG